MCKGMYMINKDLRRQNQGFFSQLYFACQLSSGTYYMGVTNSGNLKIQRMHDSTMQVYHNKTLAKGLKKILQLLSVSIYVNIHQPAVVDGGLLLS